MNYIDFAIGVSIFLFFFTMVLILSTNYFSNISGLTKISEFRSVAEGVFQLLFSSKGIPEDWEKSPSLNPVQLGLVEDLYRISILVKETAGYNRTDELISVNLVLDENCENKTWNNSVRVFDGNGSEIPFRMSKESFCSDQFLKQAKVVWETNLTANQNKKFYVYFSSDDSIIPFNYSNTFSTIGYWHFDEGSGNYVFDESGNNNTGTLKNTTGSCGGTACPSWVTGKYGDALEFDGIGDYVEISNDTSLNSQTLTLMAWIKPLKSNNDDPTLFMRETSTGDNLFIVRAGIKSDGSSRGVACEWAPEWWTASYDFQEDQWYHVVCLMDGNVRRVYVNGEFIDENITINQLDYSNPGRFFIGQDQDGASATDFFNGTIDEVRVWNRALSPEEINASYISGPIPIKSFPEENLDVLSSSKINALKNLSYEEILKTLGDYKFRIEISERE